MSKRTIWLMVAVLCLAAPASASAGWSELGGGSLRADPALNAREAALATVDGVPYMAWSEGSGQTTDIRVARLGRDGAWEVIGSADRYAGSQSLDPALAEIGGVLHVAWVERGTRWDQTHRQVQVARLEGGAFVPVAETPSLSADADSADPALAGVGGVPHVAWVEGDQQDFDVRAARLSGGAWEHTGPVDHTTREAQAAASSPLSLVQPVTRLRGSDPALEAIGGVLHAAWSEGGFVYVARLDGTSWSDVGGGPANGGADGASQTTLAAVGGVPYVAWQTADGSVRVRIARLLGGSWTEVAAPPRSGFAREPSLAAVGGEPWLAWRDGRGLRVARVGAAELVGGRLNGASPQAPALADVGGIPFAAWHEGEAGRSDVRLARLEPDLDPLEVTPGATSATVVARLNTFGLSFPVAFEYGEAGSALTQRTEWSTVSGSDTAAAAVLDGLRPKTDYEVRAVIGSTAGADVLGAVTGFTTTKRNGK